MSESDDLQPVSRETTASFIAGQIRQGIMGGTFPPGTQLGEADLATRFEVSRGPLREAMQRLVQEGLLHSERHRGLFVTTLETDDILDVYLARSAVERTAVSEIVRHTHVEPGSGNGEGSDSDEDGDDLAALEEAVGRMDAAVRVGEWAALADADLAFHEGLVDASGSPRLVRMNSTLLVETRMCLSALEPLYVFPVDIADEHRGILAALRERDERTALKLLEAHMDDARDKRVRSAAKATQEEPDADT